MKHTHTNGSLIAANASNGRIYTSWGLFCDGKRIATVKEQSSSEIEMGNANRIALGWNTLPEVESLLKRLLAFEQRLKASPMDGGTLLVADARALLAKIANA